MTIRRTIPLLALAAALLAAATAYAGPVGNQYVPQVPKAGNKHHDSGGSSSGTSSSSYTPATTTQSTEPVQSTPKQKQKPAKPKHHAPAKSTKVSPAAATSAGAVDSGGGPWIPIAILVIVAAVSTAAGLTLRRRAA
jgi:hypothetical protein